MPVQLGSALLEPLVKHRAPVADDGSLLSLHRQVADAGRRLRNLLDEELVVSSSQYLSDDEYGALSDVLDAHSPFDINGLLGALHAVAVAPGVVPPSAWLPVVLPSGFGDEDGATAKRHLTLVFSFVNEVVDSVNGQAAFLMPEHAERSEPSRGRE